MRIQFAERAKIAGYLGAAENVARQVAGNSRCWWRNSYGLLNTTLTIAHFDRLGLPRLS